MILSICSSNPAVPNESGELCLAPPGQPELEDVIMSPALDHLVPRVVTHVVVLVLLEEVARLHGVAVRQDALLLQVEGGALQEDTQQLVRVPGQTVGSLHS